MKHKTLVRLLLKVLGVYFLGMAVVSLANNFYSFVVQLSLRGATGGLTGLSPYLYLIPTTAILQAAVGLYLFSGAKGLLDRMIPSNRPYCPECGYELTHNNSSLCPECGTPLPTPVTSRPPEPASARP